MNKKRFIVFGLLVGTMFVVVAQNAATYKTMTPAATVVAASTTNSSLGTILKLQTTPQIVRVWAGCSGIPATTNNPAASVSNIVVRISTASGDDATTNSFDKGTPSLIYVTIPAPAGTTTNFSSDWFNITGVKYLRVDSIENNTLGIVSNVTVNIGY